MLQNTTSTNSPTEVEPYKAGVFDEWLSWKACGGLVADEEDNRLYKITLTEFCERFGIARSTANNWRRYTPNLAELIEQRRNEIAPLAKVGIMFNQMFLAGMQTKDLRAAVDAQKTYLGHFGNLQTPVQRENITLGNGFTDLLQAARVEGEPPQPEIIEGEIVDADSPEIPT